MDEGHRPTGVVDRRRNFEHLVRLRGLPCEVKVLAGLDLAQARCAAVSAALGMPLR